MMFSTRPNLAVSITPKLITFLYERVDPKMGRKRQVGSSQFGQQHCREREGRFASFGLQRERLVLVRVVERDRG